MAIKGKTDLETLNPTLAAEWHPIKNGELNPCDVTCNSEKKVWWICEHGHEWKAMISNRTKEKGCPYCSGKRVKIGVNDLASIKPEIAEEWHYEKNRGKTPQMYTAFSNKKVWWKCNLGHEWRTSIVARTHMGSGCPRCAKNHQK